MIKATTKADNKYSQIQVDKFIYLNNYYDYLGSQGRLQWEVDATTQDAWGCYSHNKSGLLPQKAKLTYNIPTSGGDDYRRVRAYPAIVLGSLNGRDSTFGVENKTGCAQTSVLSNSGRCNSEVYDLRDVKQHTSLPIMYEDIDKIEIGFKHTLNSSLESKGVDNIFLDSVFHYIGDSNTWPDTYDSSWGDYNKVNANKTSAWNLNVWFQNDRHPDGNSTRLWTGGNVLLDNLVLPSGISVSINCKHERAPTPYNESCTGGFFYVGFFIEDYVDEQDYKLVYSELVDFIGSMEFKNIVLGDPFCSKMWTDLGRPPFIVDEPENFVLDGIALGKEVWFSPDNTNTVSTFENVYFNINGTVYKHFSPESQVNLPETIDPKSGTIFVKDTIYKFNLNVGEERSILPSNLDSAASTLSSITNESDPEITSETFIANGILIKGERVGNNLLRIIDNLNQVYFIEITVLAATDIIEEETDLSLYLDMISYPEQSLKKFINKQNKQIRLTVNFPNSDVKHTETIPPLGEILVDVTSLDASVISLLIEN